MQPRCSKKEKVTFAICHIDVSGYWFPMLEWRNESGILKTWDVNKDNTSVNYTVIWPFVPPDHEASYNLTCTPKFTRKSIPKNTTATNIPVFPNSCKIIIEPKGKFVSECYTLHS